MSGPNSVPGTAFRPGRCPTSPSNRLTPLDTPSDKLTTSRIIFLSLSKRHFPTFCRCMDWTVGQKLDCSTGVQLALQVSLDLRPCRWPLVTLTGIQPRQELCIGSSFRHMGSRVCLFSSSQMFLRGGSGPSPRVLRIRWASACGNVCASTLGCWRPLRIPSMVSATPQWHGWYSLRRFVGTEVRMKADSETSAKAPRELQGRRG